MTELLYDEKPYEKEFEANVISCEKVEDGYAVVVDKTLFFPEQGGQTSDKGWLNEREVFDVQVKAGVIYHYCKKEFTSGETVKGKIDWTHRFNNMQQHTGEHIFTGLAHNEYGAENVGFHLSDNTVTLDLTTELDEEKIRELEIRANQVIASDVPVKCWYPTDREIAEIQYRSKKEIDGAIRLVEITGVDICACCAPHVATTGQVGLLKVIDYEKYKGGTRIYILCGLRALADYNKKQELLNKTNKVLNCRETDIPARAQSLLEETKNLKYELSAFKAEQLQKQIDIIPSSQQDVYIFTEGIDANIMRNGVNLLVTRHEGLCAIFSGNDEDGFSFVIGSKTRDCTAIAAGLRELLQAKGGGSKQMIQGSIQASRSEIERVLI